MAANVNNYIAAGNAAVKNSYAALAAARDNAPKYDEIAKAGMKARAEQRISATKADAAVRSSQIKANSYLEREKITLDKNKSLAKSKKKTQFAGKIAAAGAVMATSLLPSAEIIKPRDRDFSSQEARYRTGLDKANAEIKQFNTPKATTVATASGGKTTPAADFVNTNITSTDKGVLDVLGKYESDGVGSYNAINQIGIAGGRGVQGYSGDIRNMQQHGGRALTDFTVGEIMNLQNNSGSNRQLSNQEWINSGRLHAVGRYQFIGPTFAAEVNRQGISRDAKFTPQLQDQMALSHLRRAGSISPWVGPSDHATSEERALVNNWFSNQ